MIACYTAVVSGVLCGGHTGVHAQQLSGLDCTDKESIQHEQLKCFSHLGLSVEGLDTDQLQNIMQKDPEFACR